VLYFYFWKGVFKKKMVPPPPKGAPAADLELVLLVEDFLYSILYQEISAPNDPGLSPLGTPQRRGVSPGSVLCDIFHFTAGYFPKRG
jgi:hypothetical protein